MDERGQRRARWAAVAAAASVGVLTLVFLLQSGPRLPPIAFSVQTDYRQYDIAVTRDGSARLLTDDRLSYAPAWSPDGSQIAFIRGEPGTWEECCGYAEERLWVMDADGGDQRAVSELAEPTGGLHWTPDGSALLYHESGGGIVQLDVETGDESTILATFCCREFSPSPDGTRVATGSLKTRQILLIDLDDGSEEIVANDVFGYGEDVVWSPDGEWLVMKALVRGVDDGGVWAWNLETEELVAVSASQKTAYTWVGGDELLICRQIPDPSLEGEFYNERGELWLVEVGNGGGSRPISGYDESLDPSNPPGNCIGEDMDARVVTP